MKKSQMTDWQKIQFMNMIKPWSDIMPLHIEGKNFQEFLSQFNADQKEIIVNYVTKTNVEFILPAIQERIQLLEKVLAKKKADP